LKVLPFNQSQIKSGFVGSAGKILVEQVPQKPDIQLGMSSKLSG